PSVQVQPDLPGAEQVEVVDHQTGYGDQHPANGEQSPQQPASERVLDVPDDGAQAPPLPHQEKAQHAGYQDVGAALDRLGDQARPAFFSCIRRAAPYPGKLTCGTPGG